MLTLLQQYLPFTVLKRIMDGESCKAFKCCNSTYRLRYWNNSGIIFWRFKYLSCNSTYRLRYWNVILMTSMIDLDFLVATVLTVYGIETCKPYTYSFPFLFRCNSTYRLRYWNLDAFNVFPRLKDVATVLTVYGIETLNLLLLGT